MKWILQKKSHDTYDLGENMGISPVFADLLIQRGVNSPEKVKSFLKPRLEDLGDLSSLDCVKYAFEIITAAIKNKDKITVYGDYDVDGIMSTVILTKGLRDLGANIDCYIPDRFSEGYGLNMNAVSYIHDNDAKLVICCDNGISALEECSYIKALGMKLIILDHHSPHRVDNKEVLPVCDAVIDMKTENNAYGFKDLCAAGLCYRFINGLYSYLNKKIINEAELFIFASIATICDMVELKGENRVFAHLGLRLMNSPKSTNPGLREILIAQNIADKPVTDYVIGYIIGPLINAAGRMDKALNYIDIFLSRDIEYIRKLVDKLKALSDERKRLTGEAFISVKEKLGDNVEDKVIVEYSPNIHESLAGLVAGRLKDQFNRPAIVFTKSGDNAKGSGRSTEAYDMFSAINECRDLFIRYGGHKQAVGITLSENNIDILREKLNSSCALTEGDMEKQIYIDTELPFSYLTLDLCKELNSLKPCGMGNPEPVFITHNVFIKRIRFVGKEKRFIQFVFYKDNKEIRGVSFDIFDILKDFIVKEYGLKTWEDVYSERYILQFFADIVYRIEKNSYNGYENVQIRLIDFRKSAESE